MAFQFLCPQGHLLEAEETQSGQPCQCPYCQVMFLVPGAPQGPPPGPPSFQIPPLFDATSAGPQSRGGTEGLPTIQTGPTGQPGGGAPAEAAPFDLGGPGQSPIVHILCPSGHELETPREMLGQEALCPFCQVQFLLRFEDSIEHRQRLAREQELLELKKGRQWMQLAIVAAVLVVSGLIALMILSHW